MKHTLKKIVILGTAALLLAGCSDQSQSRKTQQITGSAEASLPASETPAQTEALQETSPASSLSQTETTGAPAAEQASGNPAAVQPSSDPAADAETYYKVKAEKESVEIEIENLEAAFRIGSLSQEEFFRQKTELKALEDKLNIQEDALEYSLKLAARSQAAPSLPQGTPDELLTQKRQTEIQEDELDLAEDKLELSYRSGEISREEFIARQTELNRQKEALDRQEELLEWALESMGIDD